MADKEVALSLKLDSGSAETSMKNFKTQVREAQSELDKMTQKFGATSAEAVNAAKKVANLKDSIGAAKNLTDAFNPDAKFKAFSNAIGGVVGGFSGLTGAMALFGGKSAEVEQTLLKVQAAMAFSQGVNSVLESKDAFIALGAKIKDIGIFQKANALANQLAAGTMKLFGVAVETTSTSFKVLKGAIAATGIGLLVVLIGEAVSAFDSFTSSAAKAEEAQKNFNDATVAGANSQLKSANDFIKRQTDLTIARARVAGASEKEIQDIQEASLKKQAAALQVHYNEIKGIDAKAAADDLAAVNGLQNQLTLSQLQFQLAEKQRAESAAKEREQRNKEEAKAAAERLKQQKENEQKIRESIAEEKKRAREQEIKDAEMFAQMDKEQTEKEIKLREDNERKRLEAKSKLAELGVLDNPDSTEAKIAKIKADLELELNAIAEGDLQKQVLARRAANEILQIEKDAAAAKVKIAELSEEQKIEFVANALGAISDIVGRETAVGKTLAVGQAIINTYLAATKALATYPPPFGQIAAGISIAAGLANVKKILEVKLPGKAGGGSTPSISSGSAPAPLRPEAPAQTNTRIDADQLNRIGNATVRAYVLDQDSVNNRERNERLNRAARLQ